MKPKLKIDERIWFPFPHCTTHVTANRYYFENMRRIFMPINIISYGLITKLESTLTLERKISQSRSKFNALVFKQPQMRNNKCQLWKFSGAHGDLLKMILFPWDFSTLFFGTFCKFIRFSYITSACTMIGKARTWNEFQPIDAKVCSNKTWFSSHS